ncbi:MAG: hypothetical protein R6X16_17030 [Anaerolineae bacterium]
MATRNNNATARNLTLDIALTIGFLASLKPFLTGIALHELLGLAVGGALVLHGLLHRKWISAITCRLGCKMPLRTRICYLLDATLMVAFGTLTVTGVLISQAVLYALGISVMPSLTLATLHNLAAWTALGALAFKLALHSDWIGSAVRCHILRRSAVKTRRTVRCPEETATGARGTLYSRRQFLSACGLGLGSAILFTLWRNWEPMLVQAQGLVGPVDAAPTSAAPAVLPVSPTLDPTATTVTVETVQEQATAATAVTPEITATSAAVAPPTSTPAPAVTLEPLPTATPVQAVKTRCPYGLVNDPYPGKCRRYVDSNGNGFCDLSEVA